MSAEPKVSIIIPCYNREKFIADTLECVQKINYPNWECIIADSGSTDNSVKIICEFEMRDKRIQYVSQPENSISISRNIAISHSSGDFILPLDSDDLIHPDYVKEAVETLVLHPEVAVVTCGAKYFGSKKGRWEFGVSKNFEDFLVQNCLHNTSMYRRADYDKTGGYDPALKIAEDWDLWISILQYGGKIHKIEKTYFYYRRHKGSTYLALKKTEELENAYKIIYSKHKELYSKLLDNPILLLKQHKKYKKGYNQIRMMTLRRPLP